MLLLSKNVKKVFKKIEISTSKGIIEEMELDFPWPCLGEPTVPSN